jgi:hypothetical protein
VSLRIGLDVDGVLADFRSAFRALARPHAPAADIDESSPAADLPLAPARIRQLWDVIARTPNWWLQLDAYEPEQIQHLYALARQHRWEVFFLTKRPKSGGDTVLVQTQWWLEQNGFYMPPVITVPGSRGELANALRLDLVVDDRMENCAEVISSSSAKAVLMLRDSRDATAIRTLATSRGVGVVKTLEEAIVVIQRLHELLPQRKGRIARLSDWFRPQGDQSSSVPLDPRPFRTNEGTN